MTITLPRPVTRTARAGDWTCSAVALPGTASLFIESNTDVRRPDGTVPSFGFHCPDAGTTTELLGQLAGGWQEMSAATEEDMATDGVGVLITAGRDDLPPVGLLAHTEAEARTWTRVLDRALVVLGSATDETKNPNPKETS